MATAWIVEAIDILKYRAFCLTARVPTIMPDQLGLDGFEERLDHGIVVTISLTAHPDLEAVLFQALLIRVGTILRAAIRMVNAAFGGWRSATAMSSALIPRSCFMRLLTAQPMMRRE